MVVLSLCIHFIAMSECTKLLYAGVGFGQTPAGPLTYVKFGKTLQ